MRQKCKYFGYNYNSSEWYKSAYKIFNKEYQFPNKKEKIKKKVFKNKIIEIINLD